MFIANSITDESSEMLLTAAPALLRANWTHFSLMFAETSLGHSDEQPALSEVYLPDFLENQLRSDFGV